VRTQTTQPKRQKNIKNHVTTASEGDLGTGMRAPTVGGVSMSIVAGIITGQGLGTRGRIVQVLKEQEVFKQPVDCSI
jgi:hypothetical protein